MKAFLLAVILSSCSMQSIVVSTTAPIIGEATKVVETESNWEQFRMGVPGNLTLMEGFLFLDPNNEKLLSTLAKGWGAYAYVIDETLYLGDALSENERTQNLNQAIFNYARAFKFGKRYLEENDIKYQDLVQKMNQPGGIVAILEDNLSGNKRDLEAVLFTAQSLGSLVNLQRTNMSLIAQLPVAKGMFDWVCEKDPEIYFNMCDIFYGYYEASRPRMLGGNPEKGKRIFLDLIKKKPENWMARVAYIQYYLIPMIDEDGYRKQKSFLSKMYKKHQADLNWHPQMLERDKMFKHDRLRLFQTLAMKRYEIIKKNEKEIF